VIAEGGGSDDSPHARHAASACRDIDLVGCCEASLADERAMSMSAHHGRMRPQGQPQAVRFDHHMNNHRLLSSHPSCE